MTYDYNIVSMGGFEMSRGLRVIDSIPFQSHTTGSTSTPMRPPSTLLQSGTISSYPITANPIAHATLV